MHSWDGQGGAAWGAAQVADRVAGGSLGAASDTHSGQAGQVVLVGPDAQTEIEVGASVVAVVALRRVEGVERFSGVPREWEEMVD